MAALGLVCFLVFCFQSGAAAVVALGTAGPGYFPVFMDPELARPLPVGPVVGLAFSLVLFHLALILAHRFFESASFTDAFLRLLPAWIAFVPWCAMPLLPLYAQRLLFVTCLVLYVAIAALAFGRQIRAAVTFARRHWPAFVWILLGVILLMQLYLALLAPHDYAAYVFENELDNKYKRNLMRAGFALLLLSYGAYVALRLWRPGPAPAGRMLADLVRRLRAGMFAASRTEAPGDLPVGVALGLLLLQVCAGTLILFSFFALPEYAPLAFLRGTTAVPVVPLALAGTLTLAGVGSLAARVGPSRAARTLRVVFWLSPWLLLNLPFFEYRSELLTVALLALSAFFIAREAADWNIDERWLRMGTVALFVVMFAVFIFVGFTTAVARFHAFLPLNLDLTVQHQALWTLSHHGYPFLSIGEKDGIYDRIYWPDHVPFFYYVLAPFYLLAPSVETLLLLQTLFIAAGAVPVFLMTRRVLGSTTAGAVGGLLFLLHPGFQLLTRWDVHEGVFAIAIFLLALYLYELRRPWAFLFTLGLGGCVREEMGLFGVSVGLMLLLARRDVRFGTLAVLLGACQFVLMSKVMQAYFGGLGHYERYYPLFFLEGGYSVQNILYLLLWNPLFFFANWWDPAKLVFVVVILAPLGFAPVFGLLRWRWMLLLAGLASTLLAVRIPNYTPGYQYSILLLIGCFYLMPHGLRLVTRGAGPRATRGLLTFLLVMGLGSGYLYGTLLGKTEAISFMGQWNPDHGQYEWNGWLARSFEPPRPTPAHDRLRDLLRHVPDRVPVASSERISTHLSGRGRNYTLPRIDDAEYIVCHADFEQNPSIESIQARADFELWKRSEDGKSYLFRRIAK